VDAEAKEEQLRKAEEKSPGQVNVDDLNIFSPEPEVLRFGGREYKLLPLKIKEMRLLVQLSKLKNIVGTDEQLDGVKSIVSQLIKEPDMAFLEDNLDTQVISELFQKINRVNYGSMPRMAKGALTGNASLERV
jgi:hypothetical protein